MVQHLHQHQQQELQQRLDRCRYLIDELEGCGEWGCRQADSPALLRLLGELESTSEKFRYLGTYREVL